MTESELIARITVNPKIFGGKPIIRGRRIAVEHVLDMLAVGDTVETILSGYSFLEREDIQACMVYARKVIGHERIELDSLRGETPVTKRFLTVATFMLIWTGALHAQDLTGNWQGTLGGQLRLIVRITRAAGDLFVRRSGARLEWMGLLRLRLFYVVDDHYIDGDFAAFQPESKVLGKTAHDFRDAFLVG